MKTIVVTGATGAQGGGLVRAIFNDPKKEFAVRAITRDPNSEKAKQLAALGAEVVAADLDDQQSLENAFKGAYGAFCVTNFWEHFSAEKEYDQARNLAQAAKSAGIQHAIWSTLEDMRLSNTLGEEVVYNEVSPNTFRSFGFPGADDVGNMFQFYQEFEDYCCTTRDINFSKELNPELQDFKTWVAKNKEKILVK